MTNMKLYGLLGVIGAIAVALLYYFDFFNLGLDRPIGIFLGINLCLIIFRRKKIVIIISISLLWSLALLYFITLWLPNFVERYLHWLFF